MSNNVAKINLIFDIQYNILKKHDKKEGIQKMKNLRKLYGKAIIDCSDSEELCKGYKVELEYYQTEDKRSNKPYGIEIVKKCIQDEKMQIEEKRMNHICCGEQDTNNLLEILISNKVTPIALEDVIHDFKVIKVI